MIRDLVLDAQTAEPAVRQVDLNLPAEQPLRADGKNVADDEHQDHEHRVKRRAAARRVVGCKLSTHPGQIEHGGDLAHKVIARYHLVGPKLVEKLLLLVLQPPHHRSPPQRIVSERRNHRSKSQQRASATKSALLRHGKIADGLPLSGEERSCSGHHRNDLTHLRHRASRNPAVQQSRVCYSFRKHGRHRAVNRRKFITLLSGAAAVWPLATRAQQPERVRRIGMLLPAIMNDDAFQDRIGAFLQGLQEAGWSIGRNVRIDTRWGANNPTEIRRHATELAALAPDVVVAFAASTVGAMLQATSSVPIVFAGVADPVAAGFADSLARPGRNATGFLLFEYGMAGKLLELLKEIAPGVIRAGVLRDPATPSGPAQFGVIQAAAPSLRMEVSLISMRDAPEIEQAVAAFAHSPNNGLIVPASGSAAVHRTLIIMLAARHRLPAVYASRAYVASGGLASYGPDYVDQFRRSASYVDRILKGEKPADLPVQAPTKYELVINVKTAKALGLEVPPTLLTRADEVIE